MNSLLNDPKIQNIIAAMNGVDTRHKVVVNGVVKYLADEELKNLSKITNIELHKEDVDNYLLNKQELGSNNIW